ncbi:hypothetical protein Tco_0215537 [Tanacetum coccineum]
MSPRWRRKFWRQRREVWFRQDLGFIPSGNVVLSSTYVGKILGADQLLVILCYRYQEFGIGYWILSMTISGSGVTFLPSPYQLVHVKFGISSWHGSRVDGRSYLLSGAIDGSEANRIISDFKQEVWNDCMSCKVRISSNGNLLWEVSVLLGRKKDDRGVTEGREDVLEVFQQRRSGAKDGRSIRCRRNQMGNEPILALPEEAGDFIVYYDARSKDLEACLEKGRSEFNFEAKYHLGKANVDVVPWKGDEEKLCDELLELETSLKWCLGSYGAAAKKRDKGVGGSLGMVPGFTRSRSGKEYLEDIVVHRTSMVDFGVYYLLCVGIELTSGAGLVGSWDVPSPIWELFRAILSKSGLLCDRIDVRSVASETIDAKLKDL